MPQDVAQAEGTARGEMGVYVKVEAHGSSGEGVSPGLPPARTTLRPVGADRKSEEPRGDWLPIGFSDGTRGWTVSLTALVPWVSDAVA
jgi:hypothetical protein